MNLIFDDNFTRADSATVGNNWLSNVTGGFSIASDKLILGTASGPISKFLYRPGTGLPSIVAPGTQEGAIEQRIIVDTISSGTGATGVFGVWLRFDESATNGYLLLLQEGLNALIYAVVGGTPTPVGSSVPFVWPASGHAVEILFSVSGSAGSPATVSYTITDTTASRTLNSSAGIDSTTALISPANSSVAISSQSTPVSLTRFRSSCEQATTISSAPTPASGYGIFLPTGLIQGNPSTGAIYLTGGGPLGSNSVINLTGTNATVPASVTIPSGSSEVAFAITPTGASVVVSSTNAAGLTNPSPASTTAGPANGGGSGVTDSSVQADVTAALIALGYTASRASKLDDLDAAVSSRSTYSGADTAGTTTLLSRIPGTIPANGSGFTAIGDNRLANLDAAVSSRSTYSGTDTAGTTTLLSRVTGAVALASQVPANLTSALFSGPGVFAASAFGPNYDGIASAGSSTTITLQNGTPDSTGRGIVLTGGTGAGQARTLLSWNSSTGVYTVDRPFTTAPDNTTQYSLGLSFGGLAPLNGLALASQIPSNFTSATFSAPGVFAASALANAPTGGSGGGSIQTGDVFALLNPMISSHVFTSAALQNVPTMTPVSNPPATLTQIQAELDSRSLTSSTMSRLDANITTRSTYAGGVVAGVTAPVTVGTVNDKSGYILASAGLDSIVIESGVNARQALSPILAASAGVVAGAGTGVIVIKGGNVSTTRITATTDNAGNRSSVTLSLPN